MTKPVQTTTYLIPIAAEGPAMEKILQSIQLQATCGTCTSIGCSWCNASVPAAHMRIALVPDEAAKK
ncbi:Hypothetical protein BN69_3614 [Methylocystis sp. SC2]|jgi:hypothetical protein|nr:Hypothetical protein BN69_3614 [Methylocystis sp. SC2]